MKKILVLSQLIVSFALNAQAANVAIELAVPVQGTTEVNGKKVYQIAKIDLENGHHLPEELKQDDKFLHALNSVLKASQASDATLSTEEKKAHNIIDDVFDEKLIVGYSFELMQGDAKCPYKLGVEANVQTANGNLIEIGHSKVECASTITQDKLNPMILLAAEVLRKNLVQVIQQLQDKEKDELQQNLGFVQAKAAK